MRVVVSLLMVLYFVAGMEQSVAMLLCECPGHHSDEACCYSEHCEHCKHTDHLTFESRCGCEHNVMAETALYTDGRSVDDSVIRVLVQNIPLSIDNIRLDILEGLDINVEFQPYLLPPLEDAASAASVLRAPPVLA